MIKYEVTDESVSVPTQQKLRRLESINAARNCTSTTSAMYGVLLCEGWVEM